MQSNGLVSLDYALFHPLSPTKEVVDPNTLFHYTIVFDSTVGASYFAVLYISTSLMYPSQLLNRFGLQRATLPSPMPPREMPTLTTVTSSGTFLTIQGPKNTLGLRLVRTFTNFQRKTRGALIPWVAGLYSTLNGFGDCFDK